jgi:hypothetical protein
MNQAKLIDPVFLSILGCGVVLSVGAYPFAGGPFALATAVGAGCALVNWVISRAALARVMRGGPTASAWGLAMLVKFGLLAALLWLLVVKAQFDAFGVLLGLSSMAIGTIVGTSLFGPTGAQSITEEVVQDA